MQQQVIKEKAKEAIYKLEDVDTQIASYVSDVVRSQVPQMTIEDVFTEKGISEQSRKELNAMISTTQSNNNKQPTPTNPSKI